MITFKQFLAEDTVGKHGEYVNDTAEKTMINTIINVLMGGIKDDKNYDIAYSFIESDIAEAFYEKFYKAFEEKAKDGAERRHGTKGPANLSPETSKLLGQFKVELKPLFNKWKASQKA